MNPVNEIIDQIREKDLQLRGLRRKLKGTSPADWIRYSSLSLKIAELEREIAKLKEERDNYKRVTLKDLLPRDAVVRNDVHKKLVAISLAADYLLQESEDFRETLDKLGIRSSDIDDEVKHLCTLAQKTASRMIGTKAVQLEQVLLDNEELLKSLHKTTLDYIDKTLEL